eukprot:GHVN01024239.1.p1 GENE.GHVN01024239.1~~GHVN01024239.1.p1  ORF type:complete len:406 (+),score=52.89 GHVN01024239.1:40-1218(+)
MATLSDIPLSSVVEDASQKLEPSTSPSTKVESEPGSPLPLNVDNKAKMITAEEVAVNDGSKKNPVWATMDDKVYDLTEFLPSHPGGYEVMKPYFGGAMDTPFHEVGHSKSAVRQLQQFEIGTLKGATTKPTSPNKSPKSPEAVAATNCPPDEDVGHVPDIHTNLSHTLNGIDFSKPLVPQIYNLTHAQYTHIIDDPFCCTEISTFFPWAWLEPFSRTVWYAVPSIYLPLCAYLIYLSYFLREYHISSVIILFFGGWWFWTLMEYCFHRFVFHYSEAGLPDYGCVRVCHFLAHGVHHLLPMDPMRLVMPPAVFAILTCPFWLVWQEPCSWAGALVGYVLYDMIHYASHHFPYALPYLQSMKIYHMKHHFKYPLLGFGVSNKMWDIVFDTEIKA